jgi:hypothetical protein
MAIRWYFFVSSMSSPRDDGRVGVPNKPSHLTIAFFLYTLKRRIINNIITTEHPKSLATRRYFSTALSWKLQL